MTQYHDMPILDVHTHNFLATDAIISRHVWEDVPDDGRLYSVGIHPWYSEDVTEEQISALHEAMKLRNVVAVGECGIDALRGAEIARQVELAIVHANLAESVKKPLILHCVRAGNYIVNMHRRIRPRQAWIIHGFRGTSGAALELLGCPGIYLSFGEYFNPKAVEVTPVSRMLVETDESSVSIIEIAKRVATVKGCQPDELAATKIFGI